MTHEHRGDKKSFDKADFPALGEFLPAYLHEDFGEGYGSASEAAEAFISEASPDEIFQVRKEWKSFRKMMMGRPLIEVQAALRQLGSAWQPEVEQEVQAVDEVLSRGEA